MDVYPTLINSLKKIMCPLCNHKTLHLIATSKKGHYDSPQSQGVIRNIAIAKACHTQGMKCMQLVTLITSFLLAVHLGNVSVHILDLYLITSFISNYLHIFDAIGI